MKKRIDLFKIFAIIVLMNSCNQRLYPSQVVSDSTNVTTAINYHSDTFKLKGDTISFTKYLPGIKNFDTVIKQGRSTLKTKFRFGTLNVICDTDSLEHVLDSIKETITTKEKFHNDTKTLIQIEKVPVYRVPGWCWIMILIISIYIVLKIYTKLPF